MARLFAAFVLALLTLVPPAQGAPIVFDFEDGLQGWELGGSAQRVQTQVLGGEWAIFGDGLVEGGASIFMEMDLTDVASVSVKHFFISWEQGLVLDLEGRGARLVYGLPFAWHETPNLTVSTVDTRSWTGVWSVRVSWSSPFILFDQPPPAVAFIDNITFHPIPEPASAVLLGLGLVGLAAVRRLTSMH